MRRAPHLNHRARTILCAAALAVVLPLAACADDSEGGDGDAPVLTTAEETSAAAQPETSGTQQTRQSQPTTGAERAEADRPSADRDSGCGDVSAEEAMHAGVAQAPAPPFDGVGWDTGYADPTVGFDPCADLSWIAVPIEGGTGSSPTLVMLYHRGEYLGTTTSKAYWIGEIQRDSDSQITVEYVYPKDGEGTANASGRTYASFTWNGENVDMTGEVPPA
ncbi:LppP/LprE family lipoprotein [Corynebacterium frankenforstense]